MKSKSKSKQKHKPTPKPKTNKKTKNVPTAAAPDPVEIEWKDTAGTYYDESNPLVILQKKKKSTDNKSKPKGSQPGGAVKRGKTKSQAPAAKLLSKKQRKKLEKIVERREKKKNRAELIDELQQYQLPQEVFNKLTPLVKIQTEGIRKLFMDEQEAASAKSGLHGGDDVRKVSSIKGAYKKKRLEALGLVHPNIRKKDTARDLNVLGFDQSSSSGTESEDDDVQEVEMETHDEEATSITMPESNMTPAQTPELEIQSPSEIPIPKPVQDKPNVEKEKPKTITSTSVPVSRTPSRFVHVNRTDATIKARSKLPIIPEEASIMEAITDNAVVVLAGETGCGKTTQVPQFLYEAGYAEPLDKDGKHRMIGVTEPRRVAAMAMSSRVGTELNLGKGGVSYQIRFEGNTSPHTRIKFMTDGVLLKEMEADFLLSAYSVICIDEAHERSLYTDILIGLLSRAVRLREKRSDPLKLVIMSATLKAEEFLQNRTLFKQPPAFIHVPARQFPVQIHFSRHTPTNYLDTARKRVTAIHNKLPPGGILVFVTGQLEVKQLANKLEAICAKAEVKAGTDKMKSRKKRDSENGTEVSQAPDVVDFDLDKIQNFPGLLDSEDDEESQSGDEDHDYDEDESELVTEPLHIVPLYSMLPMRDQKRVFQPPPDGHRLCVIATNVAETSLTIPSIRYVVDCGKVKEKYWDKLTGVQGFRVQWCSKASAEQRAGRAGRTGPGHCYRLYSSAVYDSDFPQYSKPEILQRPVDDMVLLMKSMSITKVRHFPYPTAPDMIQISAAEKLLTLLGAIEPPDASGGSTLSTDADNSIITPLGKTMARLPVNPRFSKMLALASTHSVLEYAVALVAALTVQEVLLEAHEDKDANNRWTQLRRKWVEAGSRILFGDAMVLLAAISEFEGTNLSIEAAQRIGVRHKAMVEIRKLRKQLYSEIKQLENEGKKMSNDNDIEMNYKLPSSEQCTTLRQIILSGCPDKIARRLDPEELAHAKLKSKHAAYWAPDLETPAFLHSGSVLKGLRPAYVVFQEAFEIGGQVFLRGVTAIEPHWIPEICPHNASCETERQS